MVRILVAGGASLTLYLAALALPSWGREFTRFLPLYGALVVLYGIAALTLARSRRALDHRALLAWIWVGAIAFRAAVLASSPSLSDDLYRYIWDGRVLLAGINPYRFAPTAPELAHLRNTLWPLINNPGLPTIYPPVLQLVFAAVASVAPTVLGVKAAMAAFDLGAGWFLMKALRARGRPRVEVLFYLWNPLVVVEFAGQGHADAVGIFFLALALRAWAENRAFRSGVALVLAGLVKFLPFVALPLLLPKLRWKWLLLPLLVALFYLPFLRDQVDALGSLGTYTAKWRSNDFLFGLFYREPLTGSNEIPLWHAKLWAAAVPAAVWLATAALRRPWPSVFSWTVGAALLVSPIVHPWYVIWLLPAALFVLHPAWWVWAALAALAYIPLPGYLGDGIWTESGWIKALEYLPVLLLLPLQGILEVRAARGGTESDSG